MKFVDLATQQERIRGDLEKRLLAVLDHGQYVNGPEIGEIEKKLAEAIGVPHAVACSSGTDALLMALMAFGIGRGDAVLTTPFTFFATAEAICLLGATPVFVDIDPVTFNLDPAALDQTLKALYADDRSHPAMKAFRGKTVMSPKAVMPVDLFGLTADYDPITKIARQHGLHIIEDAAQSFGAQYKGRGAGTLGDIGCTSFFPAKPLGCYGDGGMCFTDHSDLAEKLRSLRSHGEGEHRYQNIRIGINGRMDSMQAAILLSKYRIFDEECQLRRHIASNYRKLLGGHDQLQLPSIPNGCTCVWAQYSVLADNSACRAAFIDGLEAHHIPTAIYYPVPLHLQAAFVGSGYKEGDFPVSENCAQRIFSLPMHPYLKEEEQVLIWDLMDGTTYTGI